MDSRFGDKQWGWDAQIWASRHHTALAGIGAGALAAAVTRLVRR